MRAEPGQRVDAVGGVAHEDHPPGVPQGRPDLGEPRQADPARVHRGQRLGDAAPRSARSEDAPDAPDEVSGRRGRPAGVQEGDHHHGVARRVGEDLGAERAPDVELGRPRVERPGGEVHPDVGPAVLVHQGAVGPQDEAAHGGAQPVGADEHVERFGAPVGELRDHVRAVLLHGDEPAARPDRDPAGGVPRDRADQVAAPGEPVPVGPQRGDGAAAAAHRDGGRGAAGLPEHVRHAQPVEEGDRGRVELEQVPAGRRVRCRVDDRDVVAAAPQRQRRGAPREPRTHHQHTHASS